MAEERKRIDDQVMQEAAGWVARLQSSDATDQDRRRLEDWLSRNAVHQVAYDELSKLWSTLRDVPVPAGQLKKLRLSRRTTIRNVVALAIIGGLSMAYFNDGMLDRLRADYYTSVGQVRSVALQDGTRVDMNTDTAIAVSFSGSERRIQLLRGEAFFSVARDASRPFIVEDDDVVVRDIGTQYSIRTASDGLPGEVQVEEGSVEVSSKDQKVVLGAGDVAKLTAKGDFTVTKGSVTDDTAWRSGKLVFSGQSLRAVLRTLGRYRIGPIIVLDGAAAEQRVSGIFDLNDTDQALQILEHSLPVTVTHFAGMVVVRSR